MRTKLPKEANLGPDAKNAGAARNVKDAEAGPILVIVGQMNATRDRFIEELFEEMKAGASGLHHDARMLALWKASITESLLAGIHYLERDVAMLEAPPSALAYARASAQRDIPLSALVRNHRIGLARFLDVAMQYASLLKPEQQVPTLIELVHRSNKFVDLVADQLTVAYEQEHDRWVSRRSGLQQRWVTDLLSGAAVDVRRAEKALDYRLDRPHLAAVLWVDAAVRTRDVLALFDEVRSLLAAEVGASSLMVPTDDREARMWFSPSPGGAVDVPRLREAFESARIKAHLALGRVEKGLSGFRASLKQAERVTTVALAAGGHVAARVFSYDDVAPIALMAGDVDGLRRFVTDVLGDLAIDDERNEWLRETLREFLGRNRSYLATAEAMILHRNTIQYRVTQAMELCGQSFDDPDAVLRVQIALEACRWMGSVVLRAQSRP